MKNIYISILVLFIGMSSVTAQVGIGTTTPNENAVLDLSSTTQGMAFPSVADLTDISNPATGLMVFDMVGDCLVVNVGTPAAPDWKCTGVSILGQIGAEADNPNITNSVVTVEEINGIEGVSGAIPANETAYQDYIDNNPDLFSSPATVAEVNAMIAAVNNEASSSTGGALAQIGLEADDPDTTNSVVTASELATVTGVTGVDPANETAYQDYIDNNPDLFSSPATVEEVNAMIAAVNNEASSTTGGALAQIGSEADDPDTTNSVVTASELAAVTGVTGVDPNNKTAYQDYIDNNPDLFSSPATVAEVNAMIAAVNANEEPNGENSILAQIGLDADSGTVSSVTAAQLAALTGITGVNPDNEADYQQYIADNPDLFSSPANLAEVQAMIDAFNGPMPTYCTGSATTVVDVVGAGGATWMDRNLGATQVAGSSTDTNAYGDLYQWGRFTDGHQCRTSSTTSTNATTAEPNTGGSWDGLFITEGSTPYDWLATQDNTLWQGVSGTNNPCPSGYRLPTETEWETERTAWGSNNAAGAFTSLKLTVPGYRRHSNGTIYDVGSLGYYWSSKLTSTNARLFFFDSSTTSMSSSYIALGLSVRCIKE